MNARLVLEPGRALAVAASLAAPYVAETTRRALNAGRVGSPVDKGIMRASHEMTMQVRRTAVIGRVHVPVNYARMVHEGTRPHIIRPKRKQALRFFWKKKGVTVIAKSVRHPGTKARPWLWRALVTTAVPRGFKVSRTTVYRSVAADVG
jgi:hypothetical protein